jgi:hypothetical protein
VAPEQVADGHLRVAMARHSGSDIAGASGASRTTIANLYGHEQQEIRDSLGEDVEPDIVAVGIGLCPARQERWTTSDLCPQGSGLGAGTDHASGNSEDGRLSTEWNLRRIRAT